MYTWAYVYTQEDTTTIDIINISLTSQNSLSLLLLAVIIVIIIVVNTEHEKYSLSNFQVFNKQLLTIETVLISRTYSFYFSETLYL